MRCPWDIFEWPIRSLLMTTSSLRLDEWGLGQYTIVFLISFSLLLGVHCHSDSHILVQKVLTFLRMSMREEYVRISVRGLFTVSRVTLSAFSFPSIPQWLGVHINRMFLFAFTMMLLILIAKVLECQLYLRLSRAVSESVQMLVIDRLFYILYEFSCIKREMSRSICIKNIMMTF